MEEKYIILCLDVRNIFLEHVFYGSDWSYVFGTINTSTRRSLTECIPDMDDVLLSEEDTKQ